MNILVSNDDGIDFIGLRTLVKTLSEIGDVFVVAPEGERSSNSHHLNIKGRIKYEYREIEGAKKAIAMWGTPADCVHKALTVLFDEKFDLVVSGINKGANVSTDIIYSGTIAAAREAYLKGIPSLAISLDSFTSTEFEVAAKYARDICLKYLTLENKHDYFLNVNVPAIDEKNIKGIKLCTHEGEVLYHDNYSLVEEDGIKYVEIGHGYMEKIDNGDELVDYIALKHDYVSISPIINKHVYEMYEEELRGLLN